MTQIRAGYWLAVQRRVAAYQPDVQRALLRAFDIVARGMNERDLARFITRGGVDRFVLDALPDARAEAAFRPVSVEIQRAMQRSAERAAKVDIPKGKGEVIAPFNILNPRVIEAVRELDNRIINRLRTGVRETLRDAVEAGLKEGKGPIAIARKLRDTVGLAPNQAKAVKNFERMLKERDSEALTRTLRDRRFDKTIKRAFAEDGLKASTITKMVDAYRDKMVSFHAETLARTAVLDAVKEGQQLSWEEAADQGIVNRAVLMKMWVGVKDDREREEHLAMEGETVPFDEPFSNGQMVPGEDEYNCRCVALYFEER